MPIEAEAERMTDCPASSFGASGEIETDRAGLILNSEVADVVETAETTLFTTPAQ